MTLTALEKLQVAQHILFQHLSRQIKDSHFSDEHFTMKLTFEDGKRLYIRYNDYGEYSYQFFLSSQLSDFIRFDNFDDSWLVTTRPHHWHTQDGNVIESPMNGIPEEDIPILADKILSFLTK